LKDLKNGLDMVSAELSKFRPLSEGETQEEPGSSSFSAGKNEESE